MYSWIMETGVMAERQYFSSQMTEMEHRRIQIHQNHNNHPHLGNQSFMHPVSNRATGGSGMNSQAYMTAPRPNNYVSLGFSSERPRYGHNPHSHPSSVSPCQFQPNQVPHVAYSYNQLTIREGSNIFNVVPENERVGFKRKIPPMSPLVEREHTSGYWSGASSSSHLLPHTVSGPQSWPLDPNGMLPSYLTSQRNVRSRRSADLQLETHPASVFSSSHMPFNFHPTTRPNLAHHLYARENISGQHSHFTGNTYIPAGYHHPSMANINHSSEAVVPYERIISSGHFSYHTGSTVSNDVIDGPSSSSLTSYNQRSIPNMAIQNHHTPIGFLATSLEVPGPSRAEPPRGNGRASSYPRSQGFSHDDDSYIGWLPSDALILNSLVSYDDEDSDLFDPHIDMRLEIDDMSYEELLALEERIGNVSTGLSEGSISRCLAETTCCSSVPIQDDDEERICVICLEEYEKGQKLVKLKCSHYFHGSCIRKWLLTKNACPMCKAPALSDISKEK